MIPVQPSTAQANAFICHLGQHHYLGFEGVAGQNLRYLLRDCHGRDLACVLFAGAAWKVKARDAFIGWSAPHVEPQKRAAAPKRPGRKRGHPGACRHKPDVIDESLEVQLCSCPYCGGSQFKDPHTCS